MVHKYAILEIFFCQNKISDCIKIICHTVLFLHNIFLNKMHKKVLYILHKNIIKILYTLTIFLSIYAIFIKKKEIAKNIC